MRSPAAELVKWSGCRLTGCSRQRSHGEFICLWLLKTPSDEKAKHRESDFRLQSFAKRPGPTG